MARAGRQEKTSRVTERLHVAVAGRSNAGEITGVSRLGQARLVCLLRNLSFISSYPWGSGH